MAARKRGGMPVDINKLLKLAGAYGEMREFPAAVNVVYDATASDELIGMVLDAFASKRSDVEVRHEVLAGGQIPDLTLPCDLCVIVGGSSPLLGELAHQSRRMGTPTCVVIERGRTWFTEQSPPAATSDPASEQRGIPIGDVVDVALDEPRPLEALGTWICGNAPAKRMSLGAAFAFLRHALGMEVVRTACNRSAAVGMLVFIPGADMPAITYEQSQMVLQIASIYGQPMDFGRAKEIAVVVAGGFAFRSIARELVELIPGAGIPIKGAVAYSGTLAMGRAVLDYFEGGGAIEGASAAITTRLGTMLSELGVDASGIFGLGTEPAQHVKQPSDGRPDAGGVS